MKVKDIFQAMEKGTIVKYKNHQSDKKRMCFVEMTGLIKSRVRDRNSRIIHDVYNTEIY